MKPLAFGRWRANFGLTELYNSVGTIMAILYRVAALITLCFCLSIHALAEKRVALVIGNSDYNLAPLTNPANDADDLVMALKRLRFDVTERKDLTIRAFDDALDDF